MQRSLSRKSFGALSAVVATSAALMIPALMLMAQQAQANILAEWTCESASTGQGAGACQAVSADDVGGGKILYSSTADIPLEPVFSDQLNAADAFTFEFNQGDSPPFNGLDDTTKGEELEGQIVGGKITVTNVGPDDVKLEWDSIYTTLPPDWMKAGGNPIDGTVELDYDPMNSNFITSLDVTLFVPEPPGLVVFLLGLAGLLLITRRGSRSED